MAFFAWPQKLYVLYFRSSSSSRDGDFLSSRFDRRGPTVIRGFSIRLNERDGLMLLLGYRLGYYYYYCECVGDVGYCR